jgi:hypothetical protein
LIPVSVFAGPSAMAVIESNEATASAMIFFTSNPNKLKKSL